MSFSNCCNVFCVNGSKDCLVEAKFHLVSRWKSCMLSHWLADCHRCSVLYDDQQGLTFFFLSSAYEEGVIQCLILYWLVIYGFDTYNLYPMAVSGTTCEVYISKLQVEKDKFHLCVFMLFFESCVYSHLQEEYGAIEVIKLSLPELRVH